MTMKADAGKIADAMLAQTREWLGAPVAADAAASNTTVTLTAGQIEAAADKLLGRYTQYGYSSVTLPNLINFVASLAMFNVPDAAAQPGERAAFEAWIKRQYESWPGIISPWTAWQARAAASQVGAMTAIAPFEGMDREWTTEEKNGINDALRKYGWADNPPAAIVDDERLFDRLGCILFTRAFVPKEFDKWDDCDQETKLMFMNAAKAVLQEARASEPLSQISSQNIDAEIAQMVDQEFWSLTADATHQPARASEAGEAVHVSADTVKKVAQQYGYRYEDRIVFYGDAFTDFTEALESHYEGVDIAQQAVTLTRYPRYPRYIVIGYGETDHPQAAFVNERDQLLDAVLGMIYTHPSDAPGDVREAYRNDLTDDDEWFEGRWSAEFEIGGISIYDLGEPADAALQSHSEGDG
jgi:hypothetical protein